MLDIAIASEGAVQRFPRNAVGRDFVVGDIHGMFAQLRLLLARVSFDPRCDRLFSVGDLVDRGPGSQEALQWLRQAWFHACRGNHEQFAIDSVDPAELDHWVRHNGGGWWLDLSLEERRVFRQAFLAMPLAMEVETDSGLVGIVHADVPPGLDWDRFVRLLAAGDEEVRLYALASRRRLQLGEAGLAAPVAGAVSRVYCGHTPVRGPFALCNVHFLDTGAVYALDGYREARLTAVQIHPRAHVEYELPCEVDPPEPGDP
jgi:serine/threonine protein phosphatase 1